MQQDSLRAVLDSVFAAPDYVWVERTPPLAFLSRWLEGFSRWLQATREAHPFEFRLLLGALVILLVLILVHAGWILFQTIRRSDAAETGLAGATVIRRDHAWYRREADRLAAQGRYVEAMQADFLALVLALDAADLLRFHPAKTPAEYCREPRLAPSVREDFRELVRTLYGYAFARWPCEAGDFEAWRARAEPDRYARAH